MWVRDTSTQKAAKSRQLKEKECYKWIEALSTIRSETPVDVEVICVCDREADMSEFFVEAQEIPFVIRAAQDRVVDDDVRRLRALAESLPVAGEFRTQVVARGTEPAREATLCVHWTTTTLLPPRRCQASHAQEMPAVAVHLVWVGGGDEPA